MLTTHDVASVLITFGGIFIIGLAADLVGRHTPIPRVTLLLLSGFLIGPSVLNWLPSFTTAWFPLLTDIALAMVGFLLGQKLTLPALRKMGRPVLAMSIGEVVMTSLLVFTGLSLCGAPLVVAMLLAGIAPATAPAATVDLVHESGAQGEFTDTLLGIVAIDDAWGLVAFSIILSFAQVIYGNGSGVDILLHGAFQIGGAVALGLTLGLPMTLLTGRIQPGEPTQAEALGLVLLCAGIAVWLDVSHIVAAISLGAMVANCAKHHERPFHAIEGIEWPFLILFFIFAGAALRLDALTQIGQLGVGYIILRIFGRSIGTRLGGRLCGADKTTRKLMGFALLPQAGVAIGMALLASQQFPQLADVILPTVLGTTIFFELIGPVVTRRVLITVGDVQR